MKKFYPFGLFALSLNFAGGQVAGSSLDRTKNQADHFLRSIGMASVTKKSSRILSRGDKTTVRYGDEISIDIDRVRGIVVGFKNEGRLRSHIALPLRARKLALKSERDVQSLAQDLKARLGLPLTFQSEGVRYLPDGKRIASGSFSTHPKGYGFYSRGVQILFTVDPLDGALLSYDRMDSSRIEAAAVKIRPAQARTLAAEALVGKGFKIGAALNPQTAFTMPNGEFGGIRYPTTQPYRLRLAYGFAVSGKSSGQVWVDAATGQILGGFSYSRR